MDLISCKKSVMIWFFVVLIFHICSSTCPSECTCAHFVIKCQPGIEEFPSHVTDNNSSDFRFVDISGSPQVQNNFPALDSDKLASFKTLMDLRLAFCNILSIPDQVFAGNPYLFRLDLSNNKMSKINQKTFFGLSKLRRLELSGNENLIIEKNTFTGLPNLRELFLGNMGLEWLDPEIFSGLDKLESLYLDRNKFFSIENLPDLVPSLTHLDLSYNKLSGFSGQHMRFILGLHSVILDENPFQCNCEILLLKHNLSTAFGGSPLTCAGPPNLRGQLVSQVKDQDVVCTRPKVECPSLLLEVFATSRLDISCNISGDPVSMMIWTNPRGQQHKYEHEHAGRIEVDREGVLHIHNVSSMADRGQWTVQVSSQHGADEKTIQLKIYDPTTTTTSTTTTTATPMTTTTTTQLTTDSTMATVQESVKESGLSTMTIAGGAGGAGLLGVIISIIVYVLKRKGKKDKVGPMKREASGRDGFDTVRTPRTRR